MLTLLAPAAPAAASAAQVPDMPASAATVPAATVPAATVPAATVPAAQNATASRNASEARTSPAPEGLVSDAAIEAADKTLVTKLSNGLTVLIKKDERFPLVSLRLFVHAGSAYESPEEAGISHLLEHMVFKGTAKYPGDGVSRVIEQAGGYFNAYTSFDETVYLTDMTSDNWKLGLDVLKEMAFRPSLNPGDLEREKDVVVSELKRGDDNPKELIFDKLQARIFKGTPYAHPIIGFEETVRAVTVESMRAYIARLYQPQNMLLVVCGNVDPDDALAEAELNFGNLQNSRNIIPPIPLEEALAPKGLSVEVMDGPWQKAHLAFALPVPNFTDARGPQYDLLAQLLGGDATARFYRTYKYEKRLVDSISVGNWNFQRLGMLYISVTLDADKIPAFWDAFVKDLAGLEKLSFSKDELARARLNIEDSFFRARETLSGYASKLGNFAFFFGGEQGEVNYLRTVRETGQPLLTGLIRDTFRPDALSVVALLPKGAPPPKGVDNWQNWLSTRLVSGWKAPAVAPEAVQAAAPAGKPGAAEVINLGQNRTLILLPDPSLPYASATMAFTGGDSLVTPEDQGLAAFTASLLTKGTKRMSAPAMEDYQSDRAASFTASAGTRNFVVSLDSPSRFTEDMFSLLQAVLVTPAMKDDEAARVRENQIAAITIREDQPTGLAFRRMFPFLFGDNPYGYLKLGEKERVEKFTAKDARKFWAEQTLQPWVLAVCGTFDRAAVLNQVKKLPLPGKSSPVVPAPEWTAKESLDLHLAERNQAHLLLVFPTVGYSHADDPGLTLLQNILSGMGGLLFKELRNDQSLGYSVTAFSWKSEPAGAIIMYIGTSPDKMQQAEEGFYAVIDRLHSTPLPGEELERGKNQMQADYYREHQTLSSRSGEAAGLAIFDRPLDEELRRISKAREATPETLQELARKYLIKDKVKVVRVLP